MSHFHSSIVSVFLWMMREAYEKIQLSEIVIIVEIWIFFSLCAIGYYCHVGLIIGKYRIAGRPSTQWLFIHFRRCLCKLPRIYDVNVVARMSYSSILSACNRSVASIFSLFFARLLIKTNNPNVPMCLFLQFRVIGRLRVWESESRLNEKYNQEQ